MSDQNHETEAPERQSSKRTQRYRQPQPGQERRRNLLKALGIGGGVTVLGGVPLLWKLFGSTKQPPNEEPAARFIPPTSLSPTSSGEDLSPEAIRLVAQLSTLNREVVRNPKSFKEVAPKAANLALEYFLKEMDYDASRYSGQLHFLWDDEFKDKINSDKDCIDTEDHEDVGAVQHTQSYDIDFNLTRLLNVGLTNVNILNSGPIFELFKASIHELHHAVPPILEVQANGQNLVLKGVMVLKPKTETPSGGYICAQSIRHELEEALIQESTNRMIEKLGLSAPDVYSRLANLYKNGVINNLFNGDNKPLLQLHQQTKQNEFFALIGEKIGASIAERSRAGEDYLIRILLERL